MATPYKTWFTIGLSPPNVTTKLFFEVKDGMIFFFNFSTAKEKKTQLKKQKIIINEVIMFNLIK